MNELMSAREVEEALKWAHPDNSHDHEIEQLAANLLMALHAENVGLQARLRESERARDWFRDHVTEEGFYDAAVWGDPFAISVQLRRALSPEAKAAEGSTQ